MESPQQSPSTNICTHAFRRFGKNASQAAANSIHGTPKPGGIQASSVVSESMAVAVRGSAEREVLGFILGLYWGIMEKKMEATIMGYIGVLYWASRTLGGLGLGLRVCNG